MGGVDDNMVDTSPNLDTSGGGGGTNRGPSAGKDAGLMCREERNCDEGTASLRCLVPPSSEKGAIMIKADLYYVKI